MRKFFIPLGAFALIGVMLFYSLHLMQSGEMSPRDIPSPLIGKPLPEFALPTVADPNVTVSKKDLLGRVYLLNVWASWCAACKAEHPVLMDISRRKLIPVIGLNYKDARADAMKELAVMGDPYETSLADRDGRLGIELGVYGVPETFLIDADGVIRYKHIGPITAESLEEVVLRKVRQVKAGGGTG